jgi:thiol-disulfide isomerase/thioredoxin
MRTVASVGDKPLPIVAGAPGASLRAETEDLDLPESSGSRISGRVVDERGKPVANARVRLAERGSPAGKVINYTTMRDGSFTLRGLRPGTSYAVIAEYQGEEGIMTGRIQAKAPQTNVRISLQPRDGGSEQGHASIQPARPRIEPISNIDPADDEGSDSDPPGGKLNMEDLEAPAEEAASLSTRRNLRLSRATDEPSSRAGRGSWNAMQPAGKSAGSASRANNPDDVDERPSRSSAPAAVSSPALDDDGPNPLPPALDTAEAASKASDVFGEDRPVRVAGGTATTARGGRRRSSARNAGRDISGAIGSVADSADGEPRSIPEDVLPGSRVITPSASGPIVIDQYRDGDDASGPSAKTSARGRTPRSRPAASPSGEDDSSDPAEIEIKGAANTPPRHTWRELAENQKAVPVDESIQRASAEARADDNKIVTVKGTVGGSKPPLARLLTGNRSTADDAVRQTICRFDPSERRLVDFQLPGVDGKMVSLHDIDADVILLDFWGSWCAPCRTSIPHLGDLHNKLGDKRFAVVGIACERGATLTERQASAAKAIRDLGIHYPVLLSSKDGNCPVQQALQIQFYPTMILVDREGHLLAREQGATEVTLTRMDRAITSALK